jgi:hypothetical protein
MSEQKPGAIPGDGTRLFHFTTCSDANLNCNRSATQDLQRNRLGSQQTWNATTDPGTGFPAAGGNCGDGEGMVSATAQMEKNKMNPGR